MRSVYKKIVQIGNYLNFPSCSLLILGFSSGVPFLLTLSTLSFRLAEAGISNTKIGLFVFATIPYCLKFLWAPFLDTLSNPLSKWLGRRKSWMFLSQIGIIMSLLAMGSINPGKHLFLLAICAFCVSFFASTQDILIDVSRIELIQSNQQGIASALESIGFRLGMLVSGAGALYLASYLNWFLAYVIMALCVAFTTPFVFYLPKEKPVRLVKSSPKKIVGEALSNISVKTFAYMVVFIFGFKFCDILLNAMSAPFLYDLGFSKVEYANITKVIGIGLMLAGSFFGGIITDMLGLRATIAISCILQFVSCLLFVIQSLVGYQIQILTITVGIESFCSGLCTTAFLAYLSDFCRNSRFTAIYFTWLYSIGSIARVLISALSGHLADIIGWNMLFSLATLAIFPALFAMWKIEKMNRNLSLFPAVNQLPKQRIN